MKNLHPFLTDVETVNIIKEKIKTNTPFTLNRFGDGEIFILKRNGDDSFLRKNLPLWGFKYPKDINEFYDVYGDIIKRSFTKSDIIGLMNKNNNIPYLKYNDWVISKELSETLGVNTENLKICNHMISRSPEVGSVKGFKDIIQGNGFHIITSHSESMKRKNLDELFEVNITYTDHPSNINFNNRDEFVDNFKNIKEQIVIMGVGLQKDYGVILRDKHNKISLDMGATMDAWSGVISRPWFVKGQLQDYLTIP